MPAVPQSVFRVQGPPTFMPGVVTTQLPARQVAPAPHTLPHAPQCELFVVVSTQLPAQNERPIGHWQSAARHSNPAVQTFPQWPQFTGSFWRSTHRPPHIWLALHPHAPAEHSIPVGHATPQPPQLIAFDSVSVSHPLAGSPSQLLKPAAHAPSTHTPVEQVAVACAKAHAFPQTPQLATLERVSVSHPFDAFPSQSLLPVGHWMPQRPATHEAIPGHALPHAPQFMGSLMVLTHRVPQMVDRVGGHSHREAWHVVPPPQGMPHAPQFALSLETSTQIVPHVRDVSSISPLQSSSTPLHGASPVPDGVQSHAVPRPGNETQVQFVEAGQSVAPAHVRVQ